MLEDSVAYSGFSVDDLAKAKQFYGEMLGLKIEDSPLGLTLRIKGRNGIFIYQKDDHQPATYTILNFPVTDIEQTVSELTSKGVAFEQYPGITDDKGIARDPDPTHPYIAWFKDPAGNYLSVVQRRPQ
jgi:predicted enzyme related to lactoylglutathione lyase